MSENFGTFFLIGFALYVVLMIVIGYLSSRGKSSGKGYLTRRRTVTVFPHLCNNGSYFDRNRFINWCNI